MQQKKSGNGTLAGIVAFLASIFIVGLMVTFAFPKSNTPSPSAINNSPPPSVPQQSAPQPSPTAPAPSLSQPQQNTSPGTSGSLTTALINQVESAIVEVNCYPANSAGKYVWGSGTSVKYGGVTYIETNYHVYLAAKAGGGFPTCYAIYPEPPNFSTNGQKGNREWSWIASPARGLIIFRRSLSWGAPLPAFPPDYHKLEPPPPSPLPPKLKPIPPLAMPAADRPYVFAEATRLIDEDRKLQILLHNSGKTPALGLMSTTRLAIVTLDFDMDKIKPENLAKPEGSSTLAPGGVAVAELDTKKNENPLEFDMAKTGQRSWLAFGFAQYHDLNDRSYEPRFCFRWSVTDVRFVPCPPNAFVAGQKP